MSLELRVAFHGQLLKKTWEDVILKHFRHDGAGVHTMTRYRQQIEASTIAAYLASHTYTCPKYSVVSNGRRID